MGKTGLDYYQSLWIIATAINLAHPSEDIPRSVVEHVTKAMGAKGCSLMLLTPDREHLLHTASYGLSDLYIRKGPISADRSISEALEGKPVAVMNALEDDRIQYHEQAGKEGIASILSVPLMLRQEIIGAIRVYTAEPYQFTLGDEYFVGGVANLGAIALENARLYESVEKDYDEFKQDMLEWRATLGHEWVNGETVMSVY
ncbi:GAF domain-containing protein [Chloroflexota bacterium]